MRGESSNRPVHAREGEQARILSAIESDKKRAVVIHGEAGIGKSHLIRWAHDEVTKRGFISCSIRIPASAPLSLPTLSAQLLDDLWRDAERMNIPRKLTAPKIRAGAEPLGSHILQLVRDLEVLGSFTSLAIFIDDIQSLPASEGAHLVSALQAAESSILLVMACRDVDQTFVPGSRADLWIERIHLGTMGEEGIAAIAQDQLEGGLLPSAASYLTHLSGGNPLFAIEVVRRWKDNGALEQYGEYWGFSSGSDRHLPTSVLEAIAARLNDLCETERSLLETMAVIDRDATFDELRRLLKSNPTQLEQTLEHLIDDRLIQFSTSRNCPRFGLAHPLMRTSILATMNPARVARLHGDVFDALYELKSKDGESIPFAELARHGCAALSERRQLATILREAADSSRDAGDYREAARWYKELLARSREHSSASWTVMLSLADASLHFAPQEAAASYTHLIDVGPPSTFLRALVGRAQAFRRAGEFDAALHDLQVAAINSSAEDRFEIHHGMAILHAITGQRNEAERALRELTARSFGSGEHFKALGHLAHVRYCSGFVGEGFALANSALEGCQDEAYRTFLLTNLGWYSVLLGEWTVSQELLREGLLRAERSGDLWNYAALLCSTAKLRALQGRFAEAIDFATRSLHLAPQLGNPTGLVDALGALAWTYVEQRRFHDALSILGDKEQLSLNNKEPREIAFTFSMMAEAHLGLGQTDEAADIISLAQSNLEASMFCAATVSRLNAQLNLAKGNPALAYEELERSLNAGVEIPFERGHLHEIASMTLGKLGRRQAAMESIDQAIEIYERIGAPARVERAKRWREANYRRPPGRPRSTLPAGITPRERDVLELVILGRTNREIAQALVLSVLTVNKHVENIMMKAGVARRTELVAFAERIGLRQPATT